METYTCVIWQDSNFAHEGYHLSYIEISIFHYRSSEIHATDLVFTLAYDFFTQETQDLVETLDLASIEQLTRKTLP